MYEFSRPKATVSRLKGTLPSHTTAFDHDARLFALDDDRLDAWNERVAICMVDGGLSQEEAEAIAWREVEAIQNAHVSPGAANVTAGEGEGRGVNRVATRANVARWGPNVAYRHRYLEQSRYAGGHAEQPGSRYLFVAGANMALAGGQKGGRAQRNAAVDGGTSTAALSRAGTPRAACWAGILTDGPHKVKEMVCRAAGRAA